MQKKPITNKLLRIFAIANRLKLPVKFVGVGEGMDDLIPFVPKDFIEALFK